MKPHPIYRSIQWATRVVCYELDAETTWREFKRGNGEFKRTLIAPHPLYKHKINKLYHYAHKHSLEQFKEYLAKLGLQWWRSRDRINAILGAIARIHHDKI
jgi:hypothetical protein